MLARKRGLKVFGACMRHDPLLSSRGKAITNWGHGWVMLGVNLEWPFRRGHFYFLPLLFRWYLNKNSAAGHRRAYRRRPELAAELLTVLSNHGKNGRFHAIADSANGGMRVLCHLPENCDPTTRLLLDARLYDAPAVQPGRPRRRGERPPSPEELVAESCQRVSVTRSQRPPKVQKSNLVVFWASRLN